MGVRMSLKERMDSLKSKHAFLDTQLHQEGLRPSPSADEISRLKREKLKIKDEIARLDGNGASVTIH